MCHPELVEGLAHWFQRVVLRLAQHDTWKFAFYKLSVYNNNEHTYSLQTNSCNGITHIFSGVSLLFSL